MNLPIENQRVKNVIDYFCDGNVLRFSKEIGISQPRINRLFTIDTRSGKYPLVSFEIIQAIINKFIKIDSEWLIVGKGEMLKENINKSEGLITLEKAKEIYAPRLIPLYDGIITAGQVEVDMTPITDPVEFIDAGDWFRDATAAMRVHGDSMPNYTGSIAALKEVYDKSLLMYGQDYGIETSEYRTLKRIQKGTKKETVLLCSDNTERWEDGSEKGRLIHEPFEVKVDDIRRIFLVLGCVRRNHSSRIVYNNRK
ncbi:S24 family peptidase [Chryseobacterium gallinarum]|uniref:S24 family peptidase n=1 Tax=Chryseobacterium gallinarum TaxID=1324352 RepID=UPI0006A6F432|nr:hypothetical protein [Chryseobacterium gallinarum]